MKVIFFETMPGEREMLSPQLPEGHDITFVQEALTPETVSQAAGAQVVSVFVKSSVTAAVIDALPDLKLVCTRSMGMDHIDTEHAKTKGILVSNVTTYAAHPVAEFTFALLLAVVRKLYPAYHRLRDGNIFDTRGLGGFNLFGKTMGVAGTGRIGKNVVAIAQGFGMNVVAYDAMPDEKFAAEHNISYVTLDGLLARSDIISIHLPYTPETHHLFDAALFGKMKKGAVLINTARGEIIDTHALVAALSSGIVQGAGLDVLEGERDLKEETTVVGANASDTNYELLAANHVLIDLPNVVITPHIAFETTEAMQEIARVTAQTITDFVAKAS